MQQGSKAGIKQLNKLCKSVHRSLFRESTKSNVISITCAMSSSNRDYSLRFYRGYNVYLKFPKFKYNDPLASQQTPEGQKFI